MGVLRLGCPLDVQVQLLGEELTAVARRVWS